MEHDVLVERSFAGLPGRGVGPRAGAVGEADEEGAQFDQDNRTRLSNIERALSSNSAGLSRTEIADIRVEAGDLARLEAAYGRTQPSSDDRSYLDRRIGELEVRARVRRYGSDCCQPAVSSRTCGGGRSLAHPPFAD